MSEVSRRLVEIFFATQALKKDTGVDDPAVKPRKVEKVAMLGAGLMGAGIAYVTADAGIPVRLKDKDDAALGRGLKQIAGILDERVRRKRLSFRERQERLTRVTGTTDYSGMKNAEVVIEAVFEDIQVKAAVLAEVEREAPQAIFASNTSSLPIGRIAEAAQRPEKVVGMHFFSPVNKMPLLEVIRAPRTAPETVATVVALGKKIGKTVIVVNDGPGFYTSRILAPYMNEAAFLFNDGAAVEDIDRALVEFGFPVGPMQLLDEVGIDVGAKVAHIMHESFGDAARAAAGLREGFRERAPGAQGEEGLLPLRRRGFPEEGSGPHRLRSHPAGTEARLAAGGRDRRALRAADGERGGALPGGGHLEIGPRRRHRRGVRPGLAALPGRAVPVCRLAGRGTGGGAAAKVPGQARRPLHAGAQAGGTGGEQRQVLLATSHSEVTSGTESN